MKLHLAGDRAIDPDAFERETLTALGMPAEIVMRHRTPQFGHVFSGDGYSAGYYSYLWSDTLTADACEAFTEAGGPYDKAVAKRLRENVFSVGNTVDPAEATAPSAAATRASPRSCASAASRSRRRRRNSAADASRQPVVSAAPRVVAPSSDRGRRHSPPPSF